MPEYQAGNVNEGSEPGENVLVVTVVYWNVGTV